MKLKLSFIGTLHRICRNCFILMLVLIGIHLTLLLSPVKLGNWHSTVEGIPVTMQLSIPDTSIQYTYCGKDSSLKLRGTKVSNHNGGKPGEFNLESNISVDGKQCNLKDSAFKKVFYFLTLNVLPPSYGLSHYKVFTSSGLNRSKIFPSSGLNHSKAYPMNAEIHSNINTYVELKSKSHFYNFLFLLRPYLGLLLILLILYQLQKILGQLKLGINFNDKLFRRVRWIGWFIICSEVIKLVLTMIYKSLFDTVLLESSSSLKNYYNPIQINFIGRLQFDISFFFLGLLILIIASIIQHGIQLQKESELTV